MSQLPPQVPENANKAPGLAVASLISGIVSVIGGVFLLVPPILAVVFGHIARSRCQREGRTAGMGISLAGLIMGYLSIAIIPIFGLLAAMAIPAFQKVRTSAQEKAIRNNARMLHMAADTYFLETGSSSVSYAQLVGPDEGKYIPEVRNVMGETYPSTFLKDRPIVVKKPDGTVFTYTPQP